MTKVITQRAPVYLQHLEGLQVRDVGDHVGREGELFAVDQQMQRTVHLKSDMWVGGGVCR